MTEPRLKIAIIGTGVAGNGAAWLLHKAHDITVYEKNDYVGGHSNTVLTPKGTPVDTGFIVYNTATYPNFIAMTAALQVATKESNMSFAVSLNDGALEYSGDSINTLFVQRRNLFSRRFHRMWLDIVRFYREAPRFLEDNPGTELTLGAYLTENNYGAGFSEEHLLPMGAAIWSMTKDGMNGFPLASFIRFFKNHGLMKLANRPAWRTVEGGSRSYVEKLTTGFKDKIRTGCGVERIERMGDKVYVRDVRGGLNIFDHVIIAAHADEALGMLAEPTADEKRILGAIQYSKNRAILHQDEKLMPHLRKAWASWNYLGITGGANPAVSLTYWMNRLQGIPESEPLFVSLNPLTVPQNVLKEIRYHHPVFNRATVEAQGQLGKIQGVKNTWFCGSYAGYGFHEDALAAGLTVAENFGVRRPWTVQESSPAARNARKTA
ncbi:MAG: FAD-dependent oxidoreductase [Micavibrio sp.]|nr:FAD-dependent oxidoreductase [Micavibrio sp.]